MAARANYATARMELEATRTALADRLKRDPSVKKQVLSEARTAVLDTMTDDLMLAWYGTPWAFNGTSVVPGEGHIACGYYISTLLTHAGFDVDRVRLAQQPSENIVKSFTLSADIHRFRNQGANVVVTKVEELGPGLYVLGLDYHAAMLWNDGNTVQMCHSSVLGSAAVLCEPALTSPAMQSDYRVVGKLMNDAMLLRWLRGAHFRTVQ
ncbi:MAG: hypothetical protein ACI9MC_002523 [Kiritimatiellia bacterium]|jgi:hypothetical protein